MTDFVTAHKLRFTSKSVDWKQFIVIILFQNCPNLSNCLLVLIHNTITDKMQTLRVVRVSVWFSVVDCDRKLQLPATSKIVDELRLLLSKLLLLFSQSNCSQHNCCITCVLHLVRDGLLLRSLYFAKQCLIAAQFWCFAAKLGVKENKLHFLCLFKIVL